MAVPDLVAFLNARLNTARPMHLDDCDLILWNEPDGLVECDCPGPAAVLADVQAKRRIVDGFLSDQRLIAAAGNVDDYYWYALADVLLILAQPYATHPDFQDSWRLDVSSSAAREH